MAEHKGTYAAWAHEKNINPTFATGFESLLIEEYIVFCKTSEYDPAFQRFRHCLLKSMLRKTVVDYP